MRRATSARSAGAGPAPTDSMTLPATTTCPVPYSVSAASTVATAQFSMTMRSVMAEPLSVRHRDTGLGALAQHRALDQPVGPVGGQVDLVVVLQAEGRQV